MESVWWWLTLIPLAYLIARAAGAGWFGAKWNYQRRFLHGVTEGERPNGKQNEEQS